MYRYIFEVHLNCELIFSMEFKSITSIAKTIDRFIDSKYCKFEFTIFDFAKDRYIDSNELMKVWHM